MAEPVEIRHVVIEYEIRVPNSGPPRAPEAGTTVTPDLVEAIRQELIRTGSRNSDVFGGRA